MIASPEWLEKVEKMAGDICHQEGCFLYDLEFLGTGRGRTLRVYVDKEGGAGIDDCSKVSRELNSLLDADDVIPDGPYNLEVSTPGVDRPLKKAWHFQKVIGKKIAIKTFEAMESMGVAIEHLKNARNFEEVLKGFDDQNLIFESAEGDFKIPISAVDKSRVVFEIKEVIDEAKKAAKEVKQLDKAAKQAARLAKKQTKKKKK